MLWLRDFVMIFGRARARTPALQPAGRPALQRRRAHADTKALAFGGRLIRHPSTSLRAGFEVVPFHETIYETGCRMTAEF
jgi:hypothetical protein